MYKFEPVGGLLALDFVNTVGWRHAEEPEERLRTYGDLLEWTQAVGLVTAREARRLSETRSPRPEFLGRVHSFRESLYRLFVRFASKRPPRPADLDTLNRVLASAPGRRRLSATGNRFVWNETSKETSPERFLWAVARSASMLLTEERPERVKRCAGDRCGWLFLDTSRTRARRWCSMSDCGNRAKAKRHYARSRQS